MTLHPPCCECGRAIPAGEGLAKRNEAFNPEARQTIQDAIEQYTPDLREISTYIHANPELKWQEVKAHEKLTTYLSSKGYQVEGFEQYPTAFKVSYTRGAGGRVFGLNSEYDALPDIGHACGHNLIAICGLGAFLAIREAMDKHDINGTVVLIGTPAEEGGAGKVHLYDIGAYEGIGACMMLHPGPGPAGVETSGAVVRSYALQGIDIEYFGKSAHAGLAPWEGVNALDAATIAYSSISALRQQLKPETRVQGVITDGGGPAPNVIPAHSALSYMIRGQTLKEVEKTTERVLKCFEGAATVTGCEIKTEVNHVLAELRNEPSLGTEWTHVMQELYGAQVLLAVDQYIGGASTDFGNITFKLPACHPMYGIPAPPGVSNHTPKFTASAGSDRGMEESLKSTTAMACVGMRYLLDEEFANKVREGWEKEMEKAKAEA